VFSIRAGVEEASFQRGMRPRRIRSNPQLTFINVQQLVVQLYNCFMLIVSWVSWSNVVTTRALAW
jgi:hypothetical protein